MSGQNIIVFDGPSFEAPTSAVVRQADDVAYEEAIFAALDPLGTDILGYWLSAAGANLGADGAALQMVDMARGLVVPALSSGLVIADSAALNGKPAFSFDGVTNHYLRGAYARPASFTLIAVFEAHAEDTGVTTAVYSEDSNNGCLLRNSQTALNWSTVGANLTPNGVRPVGATGIIHVAAFDALAGAGEVKAKTFVNSTTPTASSTTQNTPASASLINFGAGISGGTPYAHAGAELMVVETNLFGSDAKDEALAAVLAAISARYAIDLI